MTAKLYIGEVREIGGRTDPGYGIPIFHPGHPDHGLPVQPGRPSQPIYHPGHPDHGLPAYPDQGLPGGGGGRPSNPIYHPGHPDHGLPAFPDQGLPGERPPWTGGHPDQGLPVPPGITPPPVPPNLAQQVVVLWHLPGQVEWHGKVIDPSLVAGMPLPPAPTPKA